MPRRNQPVSIDKRIKNVLKEGPMVGFYLTTSVLIAQKMVAEMNDGDVYELFGGILSPSRIRANINELTKMLHPDVDDSQLFLCPHCPSVQDGECCGYCNRKKV